MASNNPLAMVDLPSVLSRVALDGEPAKIAARCATVPEALDRLADAGFLAEATTLVAHALPRREAVWWACMCACHTAPATLPEPDRLAASTARNWATRPRVETARAAMGQAEHAGLATPEAWAAAAAFWSEDGEPAAAPHPSYLTGVAVAGAVGMAASRGRPRRRAARLRRFLASARDIALGGQGRLPSEA